MASGSGRPSTAPGSQESIGARSPLEPLRKLDPALLLSSHLPPATGRATEFLDRLTTLPDAEPFVGPDQAALEHMLRQLDPQAGQDQRVTAGAAT